jgi:membrane protease YdiL (CAAX protease family)
MRGDAVVRYPEASTRPLETLLFLLPLLACYEVGLAMWLRRGPGTLTNKAHGGMVGLFQAFGVRAEDLGLPLLSLPAVGLLLTLLAWQVIGKFPWRVRVTTILGMYGESLALAAPLLPLGMLAGRGAERFAMVAAGAEFDGMDTLTRLSMALGAGVYEELVFRMAIMGGLHMLLADVAGWRGPRAWVTAMLASALLFALYHPLRMSDGSVDAWKFAFLLLGGCWFGTLFHWRGFGIAAGTHAAYDVAVLLLIRG